MISLDFRKARATFFAHTQKLYPSNPTLTKIIASIVNFASPWRFCYNNMFFKLDFNQRTSYWLTEATQKLILVCKKN